MIIKLINYHWDNPNQIIASEDKMQVFLFVNKRQQINSSMYYKKIKKFIFLNLSLILILK